MWADELPAPRAGDTRSQTHEAMGSAHTNGETLIAREGNKSREETEMPFAGMVEDKCSNMEIITVVRQMAG